MKMSKNNYVSITSISNFVGLSHVYESKNGEIKYQREEKLLNLDVIDQHLELDSDSNSRLDAWCSFVDQVKFNFYGEHILTASILDEDLSDNASKVIKEFCDAIAEYVADMEGVERKLDVSIDAARNYLYLIPAFGRQPHRVSIDADTGFVNVGFRSKHKELLTALVTNKGEVHYSFVGRGRKLVKISGTAKIKDKRDFVSFKKILRILWAV